jgi:hypothetical protein
MTQLFLDYFIEGIFYFIIALIVIIFLAQLYLSLPRRFKKKYLGNPEFKTLVIVPCRGVDYSLDDDLKSLKEQSYENYKIIAVIDSEDDPSADHIKRNKIEYVINECQSGGSGKVKAITTALRKFNDYDAFVIVDSDVLADKDWLVNLLRPLTDESYGISTTFPYFEAKNGFWSKFKTAWGFVGVGMMQSDITVFGWGGSLAFRKGLFDEKSLVDFSEAVSDDMAITDLCKAKGKKVAYVPDSIATINSPDDWPVFREWSIRQTSLLLSKSRNTYYIGILLYGSSALLFIGAILLSLLVSGYFLVLFLPLVLNEIKMFRRLRRKQAVYILVQIVLPFFYVWNLLVGSKKREITWRGNRYSLYK